MQFDRLRRREFITLIGGAVAMGPLAARAQQRAMPVVGVLSGGSPNQFAQFADAFHKGLLQTGFEENQNVAIEYRWAEGHFDRLPTLAADLVNRHVSVIFATGGIAPAMAAKKATATVPIVLSSGGDPVKLGLVASLNHPGGNLTGVSFLVNALGAKRLELLHEVVPAAKTIGFLVNPENPSAQAEAQDVQTAARTMELQLFAANASNNQTIVAAFAEFVRQRIGAFMIAADAFLDGRSELIIALAAQYAIPGVYYLRHFPAAGGLMSYGTSLDDAQRLAATYIGRILKGEKPSDLPVQQAVKVELVLNLITAKSLGLSFPPTVLARADEALE
jgi:putative ABC transport system substrate-binding protein